MSYLPAREGQHSGQLAAARDRDPHQSTVWGTLAVCCARQCCTAFDTSGSEVANIWAAISPAL
jgi:hypothetical protein